MGLVSGEIVFHSDMIPPERIEAVLDLELADLRADLLAQYREEKRKEQMPYVGVAYQI